MIDSTYRHAEELIETLLDHGPMTSREVCKYLAWSKGRFTTALRYARDHLCAEFDMAIPNPIPEDGWLYRVTQEWQHIDNGASYVLGRVDTQLRRINREVETVLPYVEKGSREWRRANFLAKHLPYLLRTLGEINDEG
jgi:hypothetical protein